MNSTQSRRARIAFTFLCFVGCVGHIYKISAKYFEFEATTNLRMDVPISVPVPALSVCWRYAELVNLDALKQQTGVELPPLDFTNLRALVAYIQAVQAAVTLQQIFELTPADEKILASCVVRFPGKYQVDFFEEGSCQDNFDVTKFFVQEHICYRLELRTDGVYDYRSSSSALSFPSCVFQIGFLMDIFNQSQLIFPVVHKRGEYPTSSIYFSPELSRFHFIEAIETRVNFFYLTYSTIENSRLPEPYNTQCYDYGQNSSQDICFTKCLVEKTLSAYKKFPFSEIIAEDKRDAYNFSSKVINSIDFNNETFNDDLRAHQLLCYDNFCKKPNCEEVLSLTQLESAFPNDDEITIRVDLPSRPNFRIQYLPMTNFFQYATYVLSCFGTWLGLSILHLNPVGLFQSFKGTKNESGKVSAENSSSATRSGRLRVNLSEYNLQGVKAFRISNEVINRDRADLLEKRITSLEQQLVHNSR